MQSRRTGSLLAGAFTFAATAVLAWTLSMPPAWAQDGDAKVLLKKMADYVASQKILSVTFDADVEVVTTALQKIQFASSGEIQIRRPDKLHTKRIGGYSDVEAVFDGNLLQVHRRDSKTFAQLGAPGSIDQIIEILREKYGVTAPGADLLLSNIYDVLTTDAFEAKHIGRGMIGGVECEHLAFRSAEIDWQIWIDRGERPIPRKYVITSKAIAAAPQYTLRINEWRTAASDDLFLVKPPEGAQQVALEALEHIDEIPPGVLTSGEAK